MINKYKHQENKTRLSLSRIHARKRIFDVAPRFDSWSSWLW